MLGSSEYQETILKQNNCALLLKFCNAEASQTKDTAQETCCLKPTKLISLWEGESHQSQRQTETMRLIGRFDW